MHSARKKLTKKTTKAAKASPSTSSSGEFQRLFKLKHPEHKMAETRATQEELQASYMAPDSPTMSETYSELPNEFLSETRRSSHCPPATHRDDSDLRSLLQALPSKVDTEALIGRVEAAHRQELRVVRKEVQAISSRMTAGESSLTALDQRVSALEAIQDKHTEAAIQLQLQLEDMEDRS